MNLYQIEDNQDSSDFIRSQTPKSANQSNALYLHLHSRPRHVPIRFSGGMDKEMCEEYHRYLDQEDQRRESKKAKKEKLKKKITDLGAALRRSSFSSLGRRRSSTCSCRSSTDEMKEDEGRKQKSRYTVTFSDNVTVYPTPHQSTYPPSVHSSIWPRAGEISRNISRNKLEFAYDGHNWKEATEEEDMVPLDIMKMTTITKKTNESHKKQQQKKEIIHDSYYHGKQKPLQLLEQELVHPAHVCCLKTPPSVLSLSTSKRISSGNIAVDHEFLGLNLLTH
uniref:Uncharacterized protein n=1 Tax=Ditylum brightwellii TaxID=49249 RepID=A0A7S4T5C5_9STRA